MSRTDPRLRKDGRCVVCGKPRPEIAVAARDPFCSADCCRKHYGVGESTLVGSSEPDEEEIPA
ncbi:MAG TPA: hypothetical protein VFA44_16650 [Gaiellaceae bacterium]|nr:hypothetical protein [Gaiellaceae bacterium]